MVRLLQAGWGFALGSSGNSQRGSKASRRRPGSGWFAGIVVLAILSLKPSLATAGPYDSANQRAVQWLESRQDSSDGSWPDSSDAVTFMQTAEAVMALHQSHRRQGAYYAGQTWIQNHEPSNLDGRARRLLVLRVLQSSTKQDVDALMAAVSAPSAGQTGQTGWGLAKRYQASPLDTALALDALRAANASFSSAEAIAYLKATQLGVAGEQGWPAQTGANTADAFTTARVVQTLAAYASTDGSLTAPLAVAVATLRSKVGVSSPPHLRASAALAYLRLNPASDDARPLLDSLTNVQRGDGGYDAGVYATALIAQAFAAAEGMGKRQDHERVDVTDVALRAAINELLGRGLMDQLNQGELAKLVHLDIANRGIANLNGLQYAVNLTTLSAANNQISDLSPLAGLTKLGQKDLMGNPCAGCGGTPPPVGETPLPLWALGLLGAALMGAVGRAGRRASGKN